MNREHHDKHLIDLGSATVETKGGPVGKEDLERTFIPGFGLTAD